MPWDGVERRRPWDGVERRRPWDGLERRRFQVPTIPGNYPGNLIQYVKSSPANDPDFLAGLHTPREKRGIVLSLDIRNFTKTMQDNYYNHVQSFLSTFCDAAVDLIQTKDGSFVNKFLGDGLLAHFPEKFDTEAINIAEDLIRIFTSLKIEYNFKFCNLSVALSNAEYIETTVGRGNYVDYTLLGSQINSLFRLLSSTEGRLVYVSPNYIDSLNRSHWSVYLGTKYFKGIIEPLACYSVIRKKTDEEIESHIAQECNKSLCPELFDNCYNAWEEGRRMRHAQSDYILTLDCNSCGKENNKCWHWNNCPPKWSNARKNEGTECCHICSNFRNCFHSYQRGKQGESMITCNSVLKELSLQEYKKFHKLRRE